MAPLTWKKGRHLLDVFGDDERVGFAGRLEDIGARARLAVVLEAWRDSTPALPTVRRFVQKPCEQLRQSGRNQTLSACGAQSWSSLGMASGTTISATTSRGSGGLGIRALASQSASAIWRRFWGDWAA